MSVERIMSSKGRDVVTLHPDRTLCDAARLLTERRIGALVVSEDGKGVRGILSERDIVRSVARAGVEALNEPISAHMTANVITCTGHAGITELMELMTERRIRHVPIVEEGELRGMVSIGDVVKQRVAEIEAESQAMREYITAG